MDQRQIGPFTLGAVGLGCMGMSWARNPRFTGDALAANQHIVDSVRRVADRLGSTAAQVAIAWLLAQGEHIVAIPGTKKLRYPEENAAAAGVRLGPDDLAELDSLPEPVGARY